MNVSSGFHSRAICCVGLKHISNKFCLIVVFGEMAVSAVFLYFKCTVDDLWVVSVWSQY